MKITYDKVKNDIWDVIKDKTDFVYEPTSECDTCINRNDWDYDPEMFDEEPPTCNVHYENDACRYFYANEYGSSDYDTPACVIGNWFVFEKFSTEDLNVSNWEELEGQGVRKIIEHSSLDLDDDAIQFLNLMQTYQDTGVAWGNAYEMAIAQREGTENEQKRRSTTNS